MSPEYPPYVFGGIGSVCRDLASELSKKGVHTTVFCGGTRHLTVEKANNFLTIVRMPTLAVPPRHFWFQVQNYSLLCRYLKDFDIVHNLDPRLGLIACLTKRLHKPLITHIHECGHCMTKVFLKSAITYWSPGDFIFSVLEYPLNEYLNRMSLNNSNHIIVCSNARLDELKRRTPKFDYSKATVIYNGINLKDIDSFAFGKENEYSIVFWGRLYYIKGLIELIHAINLVRRDYPEVLLDICGRGPLEPKIRMLIEKLDLTDNVNINGYLSKDKLVEKIRSAYVIVLPSLHEGQPMTALEGMAYGKCIIMYDYPFSREYITDWQDGLIAKGNNIQDLSHRILVAFSDPNLRSTLGERAKVRVRKNHDWTQLTKKYIDIYNDLAVKGSLTSKKK